MTQMQIDISSPARQLRNKRARSPSSSPSPLDQPTKRFISIHEDGYPFPLTHGTLSHHHTQGRRVTEDFVTKTRSLRLKSDSPCLSEHDHAPRTGVGHRGSSLPRNGILSKSSDQDVQMTTDVDNAVATLCSPPLIVATPPSGSVVHLGTTTPASRPSRFLNIPRLEIPSHPQTTQLTPPQVDRGRLLQAPPALHIHLQPPTPLSARSCVPSPMSLHPPSPLSPGGMLWSPASTSSALASPTRRRMSMGPRPDCEKCRLGVKGHWMHID